MSDFLSQLADRALARPPIVRPRLQSIYESPAASAFHNSMEEHLEVPAEPPRVFESAREKRLPRGNEEPGPKEASAEVDRMPVTPEQKASRQALPQHPTVPKWNEPPPIPLPEPIESPGTIKAADYETSRRQTAREERHFEPVARARGGQPAGPFEQEKTRSSDHSLENDLDAQTPVTAKEPTAPRIFSPESKAPAKKPASPPTVVTAQVSRRPFKEQAAPRFPLKALPREVPPFGAAPSVHVTIGRVEVRAILPPASEPRSVPALSSIRLSLDEYLKRNAGVNR